MSTSAETSPQPLPNVLEGRELERYQALLDVSQSITRHADLADLFRDLAPRLQQVVPFDIITILLHDAAADAMRLHVLEPGRLQVQRPAFDLTPLASPGGRVWQTQEPLLIDDFERDTDYPEMQPIWQHFGMRSGYYLPLTTPQHRLGAIHFASTRPAAYGPADLDLLQHVARLVAVAVDNVLNTQSVLQLQHHLEAERDRLRLLLEVNNAVVSHLNLRELLQAIAASLNRVVQQDYASLALYEPETPGWRVEALHFPGGKGLVRENGKVPFLNSPASLGYTTRQPVQLVRAELERFDSDIARTLLAEGLHVWACVPLRGQDDVLGTLNLGRLHPEPFTPAEIELVQQVGNQMTLAIENALAYAQLTALKDRLAEEKLYLESEIRTEFHADEIIGESPALREVMRQVQIVAPTDSVVLLEGETGTGKELVARALHRQSGRRERVFVKLNCAAIPTGLLESELFGHEKGAFTGAVARKLGRFELAHQGTLFLDEIGDIPLELQPKLLRVLQEQEFERLGGTATHRVDVRIVAATNRNLKEMVGRHEFRSDLYYRLNVFPIALPPLRERVEDIPLLVRYFVAHHARRLGRTITTIPAKAMDALRRYPWPGNIRELQNCIERWVLLSPGTTLHVPIKELEETAAPALAAVAPLAEAEREHILAALRQANWVVGGPTGAATILGMKRTTLQSRMQKLGIRREGG